MNLEESNQPPQRSPEFAPGDSQGERRPRRPRSGNGRSDRHEAQGPGSESAGTAAASAQERRDGGRREQGPRGERRGGDGRGGDRGRRSGGPGGSSSAGRGKSGREDDKPSAPPVPVAQAPDEKMGDSPLETLGGDLLASVSRSFSLTIRLLPENLREPISLGYLIARAQDTVADTPGVPAVTRLEHLRALLEMIKYGADAEVLRPLQRDLVAKQKHDGERDLLQEIGRCLAWLEAQPVADRWELQRTLARIGWAQELDLQRFGDAKADAPKTLATTAELDEYTYLIAGCVGELWTKLCQRHLPAGWSRLAESEMLTLGKRFGQGLQTVNILRDLPEDLANGRCYIPTDLLAEHGLSASELTQEPVRARPVVAAMRLQAVEHLDAAWKYVLALTPRKLRYATALPVLIGLETLGLLAQTSPLETNERLKISRSSVRSLMASAAVGAALAPWLNRLHSKLRKRAVKSA